MEEQPVDLSKIMNVTSLNDEGLVSMLLERIEETIKKKLIMRNNIQFN